jgi:hypothetical protein
MPLEANKAALLHCLLKAVHPYMLKQALRRAHLK